jgi:hypothetical protein
MRKTILIPILLCFATFSAVAQTDSTGTALPEGKSYLPAVLISKGAMSFIGDVGYNHFNEPFLHQGGFQVTVQFRSKSKLSPSLYYLNGSISANEKTAARTLNFKTDLSALGLQISYQFICSDRPRQILVPYLSAGIEYISFTPNGDLKNSEGSVYYYWNDGSIRDIDESSPNAANAQLIHRDYNYETNLRDENLDGLGSYSLNSFAVPVGAGLKMNISGRCALHLSSMVHFTFTDNLDNISSSGAGQRQGDSKNDLFVYTSAAFSYDLGAPRETPKNKKYSNKDYRNIDFNAISVEDSDKDGVPDLEDESPDTPPQVAVDAKGKPLDGDQDGVADYLDKELNSAKSALVTEEGITLTDKLIEEKYIQDSLAAQATVKEYVRPLNENDPLIKKGIPERYKKIDLDQNGIISDKEISIAIDEFLAGKSTFGSTDFYSLVDYYFSQ